MRVLVSAPYMIPFMDRFRPLLEGLGLEVLVPEVEERLEEDDLLRLVGDIDGAICGDDAYTPRVLDAAPRLKVISKWGTGIDSIDKPAAEARGIRVCNTPDAFTEPVADSVLGYMLAFARRVPWTQRLMEEGGWEKIPGYALHEKTLGIIGVGNIGSAVARRAAAFGMRILGNDLKELPSSLKVETGLEPLDLDDLLAGADFVSLNCDLNRTSRHLIDGRALAAMRPGAVLINTARGPIVDQPALVEALRTGAIGGAALDVFEGEPLPADHPLRRMDNVLLAPHNANSSPTAWERVHRSTIDQLVAVLRPGVTVPWAGALAGRGTE